MRSLGQSLMFGNRQLWAVSIVMMIRSTAMGGVWPYMALFLNEKMHVPVIEVGAAFAILAISSALCHIVGGHISDFLGRKIAMIIAGIAGAIVYLALILSIVLLLPALIAVIFFILTSVSGGIIAPASTAMVADVTHISQRENGYALYRVLTNIGWASGSLSAGFLYVHGMVFVFTLVEILVIAQIAIISLFIRETGTLSESSGMRLRDRLKQVAVFDKALTMFSASTLLITIMIAQFSVTLSLFSSERINIPAGDIGYIYAINGLVVIIGQMPAIRIVNRINDFNGLITGSMLYAIGYLLVGFSHNLVDVLLDMIIITMGENFTTPTISTIVSKLSPRDKMGRFMAFNGMANSMGRALGPAVGSFFLFLFSSGPAMWASLDLFGISGVLLLIAIRKSGVLHEESYIHINGG